MNLTDGSGVHAGIAHGMATKDWSGALDVAMKEFDASLAKSTIIPEQEYLIEQHRTVVKKMIEVYHQQYGEENYVIIQPEATFDVELPDSMHNCIFIHWNHPVLGEQWGEPPAEVIEAGDVHPAHHKLDPSCKCYQPHRLVGKTDAIVAMHNVIWLMEHKTSSITGEQWYFQWNLDLQPSLYIWGIAQSMRIKPRGFILNTINKPSEAQIANWNSKRKSGPPKGVDEYIKFERELFLRSDQDLERAVKIVVKVAHDWEEAICKYEGIDYGFPIRPVQGACMAYNRRCDYHACCIGHDQKGDLDALGVVTEKDYVQLAQEELVKIVTKGA